MIAVPPAFVVQRHQEEIGGGRRREQVSRVRPAGDRGRQRFGEPVEDGGLNKEQAAVLVQPVEDFLPEVVGDIAMGAPQVLDRGPGIGQVTNRDSGEADSGCPPLRSLDECLNCGGVVQ